jgi:hypothetical protein
VPRPTGTLHPSDAPRPTSSEAEKLVWARLKAGLPAGWTAWHSLRIRDDKNLLGETDFVLAHPERGLLVLEVKGGQVEQRDGRWFSNDAPLKHSPLDQALKFLGRLNRRLDQWGCQAPAWGAAVAFPDRDIDEQPSQDDLRGVVLGRNHLAWLDQWLPAVVEKALPPPRPGRGEWMKRLHQLWGETWSKPLALGTRVELAKQRTLALDERQLDALDLLGGQERALIQGGAGTGKTLLAVEAARRQADAGQRVLLLCSTQPLAKWLRARLDGTGIQVETVSGLARTLAEQADGPRRSAEPPLEADWKGWFERASDLAIPTWDAVIVDEAQDFPFEAWALVEGLARGRRLWAFQDPGQCYWTDRVVPADLFGPPFLLKRGQRSPSGIEALAARYAGGAGGGAGGGDAGGGDGPAIARAVASRELVLVDCPSPAQAADRVGVEVERLWSEGIKLGDIGVVSLHGQSRPDAVHRAARLGRHEFVAADADGMEERLVADSFLRWKGLERPVIIIADVDPALHQFAVRMHIALTRALAAVRIVAPKREGGGWPGLP